jgi:hypothetical protein
MCYRFPSAVSLITNGKISPLMVCYRSLPPSMKWSSKASWPVFKLFDKCLLFDKFPNKNYIDKKITSWCRSLCIRSTTRSSKMTKVLVRGRILPKERSIYINQSRLPPNWHYSQNSGPTVFVQNSVKIINYYCTYKCIMGAWHSLHTRCWSQQQIWSSYTSLNWERNWERYRLLKLFKTVHVVSTLKRKN